MLSSFQLKKQISPFRIPSIYQFIFPFPFPVLNHLFSGNCFLDSMKWFVIDNLIAIVFSSKWMRKAFVLCWSTLTIRSEVTPIYSTLLLALVIKYRHPPFFMVTNLKKGHAIKELLSFVTGLRLAHSRASNSCRNDGFYKYLIISKKY